MANLTLSIDDADLAAARRYAAARDTTVNALVRAHLRELVGRDDRIARARARLLELAEHSRATFDYPMPTREQRNDRQWVREAWAARQDDAAE